MRLLLDAHAPPAVARTLIADGIDIQTLQTWLGGEHRDASDDQILTAAHADGRTLVTFDCRTIPELLKVWAETGRQHSGIILIDDRTIRLSDVGGLVRALQQHIQESSDAGWTDRVIFLRRA
jgi:predicted nuclease of predicted toxin-antitoxin system